MSEMERGSEEREEEIIKSRILDVVVGTYIYIREILIFCARIVK